MNTVSDEYMMHSCHCYFVLGGDPDKTIYYYVERVRDGKSFVTRTVQARQSGKTIFVAICSFHRPEPAWLEHAAVMPIVPPPESVITDEEHVEKAYRDGHIGKLEYKVSQWYIKNDSIEWRRLEGGHRVTPIHLNGRSPQQLLKIGWVRSKGKISTPGLKAHIMTLAYLSDSWFIGTALYSHGHTKTSRDGMLVSLDHTLYIHRPFRADEWLLFEMSCPGMMFFFFFFFFFSFLFLIYYFLILKI